MENAMFMGKYAIQREDILKTHAPAVYNAMLARGTLESHLADVQEKVSRFVDENADRYRLSDIYIGTEESDPAEAMRLLNAKVFELEDEAFRMWIANIPEETEEIAEENNEDCLWEDSMEYKVYLFERKYIRRLAALKKIIENK